MCAPVKRLIQAMQEIIDGQLPRQIQVDSADAVGNLTEKFNEMLQMLSQREAQRQPQEEQLRRANRELTRAKQSQAEFLSDVSHELRTPLTSIRSFCDLLLMFGDDDPEAKEEFLHSIIESCDRLTNLVNEVLDSSKMEVGKMEWNMQQIDLIEVIRSSTQVMTAMAHEKGLELSFDTPVESLVIEGDRDRLIQVTTNLINNATKFTDTGQITVSLEPMPEKIKVGVTDTGIGIAPGDRDIVFERFSQVKNSDRGKPTGTGLGLAICRDIVEQHGGDIWVESELGQGSTFYFTLPTIPADESASEAQGK
jgi:signal transduction histidine kinase